MVKNEGTRAGIGKKTTVLCAELEGAKRVFNPLELNFTFVRKGLTAKNYTFCPRTVFLGLCTYSRTNSDYTALTNRFFITERQCGYWTTRAAL